VTQLIDGRSRALREAVYGPLYPLAEWVAMNWWSLRHEVETSQTGRWRTYAKRHSLRAVGEGFALPDLRVKARGRFTELEWVGFEVPGTSIHFVGSGTAVLDTDSVGEGLARLVSGVVARLDSEGVAGTPLQEEWAAIQTVEPDEADFCKVAAALGEDPYAMRDEDRDRLVTIFERVPPQLVEEFVAATGFAELDRAAGQLREGLELIAHSPNSLPSLVHLKGEIGGPSLAGPPYRMGYAAAERLRRILRLDEAILGSDEVLARALGSGPEEFDSAILQLPTTESSFDAVVAATPGGSPAFVTAKQTASAGSFRNPFDEHDELAHPPSDP